MEQTELVEKWASSRRDLADEGVLPTDPVACKTLGCSLCIDDPLDRDTERRRIARASRETYTCPCCLRVVPMCFGAADDLADVCDDCWELLTQ